MTDRTVALPEIGKSVHLAFDVAAMEALHEKYGDNYINETLAGLDRHDVSIFKAALDVMAHDTEKTAADIINKFTTTDLALRIADAISLRLYGKKFKEQQQDNIVAAVRDGIVTRNEARATVDIDAV